MPDERLPKKVLFSQLSRGKRPQHKPKVRWRDCITNDLKDVKLSSLWTDLALTRQQWRHETKQKCLDHDSHLDAIDHERRAIHRGDGSTLAGCECHICGQRVTSERYLKSHFTQKHSDTARQRRLLQSESNNILSCPVPDCNFHPSNQRGCKIHLRRTHNWTSEMVSNLALPTSSTPVAIRNPETFHCMSSGCTFISCTSNRLKIHLRKGHRWSIKQGESALTTRNNSQDISNGTNTFSPNVLSNAHARWHPDVCM